MPKSQFPSFITELPLIVDSSQERELLARFQAARQLYNACLNEAMVRLNLLRSSNAYQEAKQISREESKKRTLAFSEARKAYRYSDYDIQAYATVVSNSSGWIAEKIDSNTQQKIATRAFKASERVLFGQAKKVRYKIPSRFRSVEGKTNKQGIRWSTKDNQVVWGNLKLKPLLENEPVILHGLNSTIKYVRLLWREINGKRRWYTQLICEGLPYQKPKNYISDGIIGLDLNVSNIAFVGETRAGLLPFAEKVPTFEKEIRKLQRKMERSRRATNPDNYHPDSESKKGRKTVVKKGKVKKGKKCCQKRIKKSLSERVHRDVTGVVMHRDLFAAYLSRFVNQNELSLQDAVNEYPRSEPILLEAWKQYHLITANRVGASESRKSDSPSERFSNKLGEVDQIADSDERERQVDPDS